MDCPKCGAASAAGATECPACGLIFARWKPERERAFAQSEPQMPVQQEVFAVDEAAVGIPRWLLAAGLLVLLAGGIGWTVHRRNARASADPTKELDSQMSAINHAGVTAREEIRKAVETHDGVEAGGSGAQLVVPMAAGFPSGLNEQRVAAAIAGCFQQNVELTIPREFARGDYASLIAKNPAISVAQQRQFIELDPPVGSADAQSRITVRLTPLGEQTGIFRESGNDYQIDLGPRVFDRVSRVQTVGDTAQVFFVWHYSNPDGALFTNAAGDEASATFREDGGVWQMSRVDVMTNGEASAICR